MCKSVKKFFDHKIAFSIVLFRVEGQIKQAMYKTGFMTVAKVQNLYWLGSREGYPRQ